MKKIVRLISAVICFFQLNVQAEEPKEYTFAINSAVTPLLHAAFINETIKTVERSVAPAKLKTIRPISSFLPRQPYGDIRT